MSPQLNIVLTCAQHHEVDVVVEGDDLQHLGGVVGVADGVVAAGGVVHLVGDGHEALQRGGDVRAGGLGGVVPEQLGRVVRHGPHNLRASLFVSLLNV